MNKKSSLLAFMLGMAIGSTITLQMIKDRYERRIEEDRKSLEEMYAAKSMAEAVETLVDKKEPVDKAPAAPNPKELAERAKDKPDIREYTRRLQKEGYVNYAQGGEVVSVKDPPKEAVVDIPYVISPDDFGEMDGYEKISLTYFADGVLADEDNEPVDDIEEIVGDGLSHFGDYEEDSVFVRNDAKKCDYEILRDMREFSEVVSEY